MIGGAKLSYSINEFFLGEGGGLKEGHLLSHIYFSFPRPYAWKVSGL